MSFLVANATGAPPIWVKGKCNFWITRHRLCCPFCSCSEHGPNIWQLFQLYLIFILNEFYSLFRQFLSIVITQCLLFLKRKLHTTCLRWKNVGTSKCKNLTKQRNAYMYQTINSHQLKRNSEVVKSDMWKNNNISWQQKSFTCVIYVDNESII